MGVGGSCNAMRPLVTFGLVSLSQVRSDWVGVGQVDSGQIRSALVRLFLIGELEFGG